MVLRASSDAYVTMDGWTIVDAADLLQESSGAPLRDWTDLARRFVEELGDRNINKVTGE